MIKTGISLFPLIAIRSNPAERAEMVTQLLFGEMYVAGEVFGNWVRIVTVADNYEGWMDKKLVTYLTEEELNRLKAKPRLKSTLPFSNLKILNTQSEQPLVAGSLLPIDRNKTQFSLVNKSFEYTGLFPEVLTLNRTNAISLAQQFLGAPYLWGGKSILGIDCSGFTQLVYGILGIQLPRDASKQIQLGNTLSFLGEAKPGDLAFFDNENGDIIHVGILLDGTHIIHASGSVRVDAIDHQGIFNLETNRYSHKLRIIKQLID